MHIIHTAAEPHADLLDRIPVAVVWLLLLIIDAACLVLFLFVLSWLLTVALAAGVVMMRVMGG